MKHALLSLGLALCPLLAPAQNGWTRITDPTNPVSSFTSPGTYKGAAWADVNQDGLPDLFAAPDKLFLNQGSGHFTVAATGLNLQPLQNPGGCSFADLDGDGDLDLALAQYPSGVYLNDGSGQFQNITLQFPGLANYAAWACAFTDYNNDQLPDLLFVHAAGFHPTASAPCRFYVQEPGFTFRAVTGYAFTDSLNPYTVPTWQDFDEDGDQDLFIASGPASQAGYDFCYKNLKTETGQDTLERLRSPLFAAQKQDGQSYSFIDADNDGDRDLCLTNYQGAPTRFYLNTNGTYTSQTTPFTGLRNRLANCWGDFDNDGDLDLFITSDGTAVQYFRNEGNLTFTQRPTLQLPAATSGLAIADYDLDGDLDVFVHGNALSSRGLFRNDTLASGNGWVSFRLRGSGFNTAAIGARLRLGSFRNGTWTWQLREVNAQNSFQGHHDFRVHFGLGPAAAFDSLVVLWPSGVVQSFGAMPAGIFYDLTEGGPLLASAPALPSAAPAFTLLPNPATAEVLISLADYHGGLVQARLLDLTGRQVQLTVASDNTLRLGVAELPRGLYLLQVVQAGKQSVQKLVLE